MKKPWIAPLIALILLMLIILLAASSKKDESVVIGVIGPFSGPIADYGEVMRAGVLSASSSERIIFEDDQCDPKMAVSAFTKLVNIDKADIIIGPPCGSPQEAIVPLAKGKTIVLLQAAASEKLYDQSEGTVFNLQYSLEKEAAFIAEQLEQLEYDDVLVISYQNAFSQTSAEAFKRALGTTTTDLTLTDFNSDVAAALASLPRKDYDAIVVLDITFFFSNGNELISRYGFTGPVFAQYAVELPALRSMVEGVTYSFPADMGEENALYIYSQNAVKLAEHALEACAKGDIGCLQEFMKVSGVFTEDGTAEQNLILKQIKDGQPLELKPTDL